MINETLIAIFIPFLSLNNVLKIVKLIANDNTNIVMAIGMFIITKKIIPITRKTLEMIAIIFIMFGLIAFPLLTALKICYLSLKLYHISK